jgi:hypothetical protein
MISALEDYRHLRAISNGDRTCTANALCAGETVIANLSRLLMPLGSEL